MRILGIDFTSAPSRKKPLTCARCDFDGERLAWKASKALTSFEPFEALLATPGPWIAGVDSPFGQPRKLVDNLGWPPVWQEYIGLIAGMGRDKFVDIMRRYQEPRPTGDKRHFRRVDRPARACSPMQLDYQPVGRMFFQAAPRLLRSGAMLPAHHSGSGDRIIIEAYPALVARKATGKDSYKNDDRKKQTPALLEARRRIIAYLSSTSFQSVYAISVRLPPTEAAAMIADHTGDRLDAFLCAIQTAWAWKNRHERFGLPSSHDPVEGWIHDPEMLSRVEPTP